MENSLKLNEWYDWEYDRVIRFGSREELIAHRLKGKVSDDFFKWRLAQLDEA